RTQSQRPAALASSLLALLRDDLDEFLDDRHGPLEVRLESLLLSGGPIEQVHAELLPVQSLVDRFGDERRDRREQDRDGAQRLEQDMVRRELVAILGFRSGPAPDEFHIPPREVIEDEGLDRPKGPMQTVG